MINITAIDINFMMSEILRLLPFFIPLIIIEYGLMIYALVQVVRNEVAYLPKWGWILIIVFFGIIGPIVYLIVGRKKDTEND
ncbi:MAG TPA: PLD nuclease N-terminal domain-containing protein [Candidatus Hydromicrobium sp.]